MDRNDFVADEMKPILQSMNFVVALAGGIVCGMYPLLIVFILLMLLLVSLAVLKVWVMGTMR